MYEPSALTLRLKVWLLLASVNISRFWQSYFGSAPYYTKFSPNRSFSIKSSCSTRTIKINLFEPDEFDKKKTYPVYINFHGSGFIIPMLGTDADFCRIMSNRTGVIVLDCDYAKAPRWHFPAAPEDVKDIISHVLANAEGYFDTSRIAVGGFSTGAMLALTAGVSQPHGTLKGVIAIYPAADFSIDPASRRRPPPSEGNQNTLPPWFMRLVYSSYMPPGTNLLDPRLSPINVPASSLPEHVLLVVCEEDPLRDESLELARKLQAEGAKVVLKELPRVGHGWDKDAKEGTPGGAARREAYEAAIDMLKLALRLE